MCPALRRFFANFLESLPKKKFGKSVETDVYAGVLLLDNIFMTFVKLAESVASAGEVGLLQVIDVNGVDLPARTDAADSAADNAQ